MEKLEEIAPDSPLPHKNALNHALADVDIRTGASCAAILEKGVRVILKNGAEDVIKADNVIIAVGMRPLTEAVDRLEGLVSEYVVIGDCSKPGKLGDAIHGGYNAARDI